MPPSPIKVLVVEDNRADFLLLNAALGADQLDIFTLSNAEKLSTGLGLLQQEQFDVVLLDLGLPDSQGLETFTTFHSQAPDLPVIVFSGNTDEQEAIRAVRAGAQDYIVKSQNAFELVTRTIRYAIERKRTARDILMMSEIQRQIIHADNLPKLYHVIGQGIQELIGDCCVAISALDEALQTIRIEGVYGLGVLYETLKQMFQTDPSQMIYPLTDMSADELKLFRSGRLEVFEKGLYRLLVGKVPKRICQMAEDLLKFKGIYTVGFVWKGFHFGGLTLLPKGEITPYKDMIETIVNQATVSIKRIKAEEALRESEERYRAVVETQTELIDRWLPDGTLTFVNDAYCRYYGKARQELIGHKWMTLVAPEDQERLEAYVERLTTSLNPSNPIGADEHLDVTIDGKKRWQRWTDHAIYDDQGRLVEFQSSGYDITEHKQAEDALRESEARHRSLVETSPDAIFINRGDKLAYINPAGLALFGTSSPEQLLGRSVFDFIHPDWHTVARRGICQEFETGWPVPPQEQRYLRLDGTPIDVEVAAGPIKWGGEQATQVIVRDITERKQVEEALRAAEEKYHNIFENAIEGIYQTSPQGFFITANPALARIMGYASPQELIEQNASQNRQSYVNPNRRAEFTAVVEEKGLVEDFESEAYRKDGSKVWISENARVVRDKNGSLLYYEGTVVDITGRKQAEMALAESFARFHTLFEASPEAIILINPQGDWPILDCNSAACEMNGYTREELVGQSIDLLNLTPGNQAEREEYLEQIQKAGVLRKESFHRRKDGSLLPIEISTSMVSLDERRVVLGIDRDITKRKHAEEQLQRRLNELEVLYETSLAIGSLMDSRQIAEKVLEIIERRLAWHHAVIRLYDPQEKKVDILAFSHTTLAEGEDDAASKQSLSKAGKPGQGLSGWVIEHGESILCKDVSSDERYIYVFPHIRSGLYVPLKIERRAIGSITIESMEVDAFTENDKRLLETMSAQVAITIENALLYQKIQQELIERQATLEVMQGLAFSKDMKEFLSLVHFSLRRVVRAENFFVALHNDSNGMFEDVYSVDQYDQSLPPSKREKTLTSYIFNTRAPFLYTPERLEQLIMSGEVEMMKTNSTSFLGIPLIASGQPIGVMAVRDYEKVGVYSERDMQFLISIAGQVALAVQRKQADEALRLSEEKYRGLMESLDSVVATVDYNGRFLYMNDMAAEQLGGLAEDFIGKSMQELFPPSMAFSQMQHVQQVIREDRSITIESPSIVKGSVRWYRTMIEPIHDESGRVMYALINATDIHELKMAQQGLQDSNRSLEERVKRRTAEVQDLYDNAPSGYHSLNAGGNFMMINQTELDWLGYAREEIIGRPVTDFLSKQSQKIFRENYPAFKQSGRLKDLELEFIRKDGSILPVLVNATAIKGKNGKFIMSRTTVEDMTERKNVEQALRNSEAEYRSLFESANDAILLIAPTGEIIRSNPKAEEMVGYSLQGHNSIDFLDPSERGEAEEKTKLLFAGKQVPIFESTFLTKQGDQVRVEINLSLIRDRDGNPLYIQSVVRDITMRKEAEETLRLANAEMEKAMRMKDDFLASISHELRTPLTGILGLSEALKLKTYGEINEKQCMVVKTIEESGHHLLDLINDVLDLSKIEAGKFELQMAPYSLAEICQASLQMIKGMAHQKRQKVSYIPADPSVAVRVDGRRIKQVLVNLLSNAVKFTPEDGELGLETDVNETEGIIRLIVWDKGIGIQSDFLPKLFMPFTQFDSRLTRKYSGSGLGLSLVKRLTELHNGGITVESTFGEGSRFIVTLPWSRESAFPVPNTRNPDVNGKNGESTVPDRIKPALVMIADDQEMMLRLVSDFLEMKQYGVIKTRSGAELLERAAETHPDLMLVDIQMPGMDGFETIRRIRAHPDPVVSAVPIIAVTALAMPGDRERCFEAGANNYMSKPMRLKELDEVIYGLLEKKR